MKINLEIYQNIHMITCDNSSSIDMQTLQWMFCIDLLLLYFLSRLFAIRNTLDNV